PSRRNVSARDVVRSTRRPCVASPSDSASCSIFSHGTPRYLRRSRDLYHRPHGAEAGAALAIRVSGSDVAREEVERARIERDLLGPILTRAHAELTGRHAVGRDGLRLREERRPERGALVVTLAVLVGVLRPEVEGLARRDIDEQLAKLRVRRDLGDDRRCRRWRGRRG